jgi:hypothetical protein
VVSILNIKKGDFMSWVTNKDQFYWIPDPLPEPTEEWRIQQSRKVYLKPDGSIVSHPGWYFANNAYANDEYFYHNENWLTIVDERPSEIDEQGNSYIIKETPVDEWEIFDQYKIKKLYKKYLHIKNTKPEFRFGVNIFHDYYYNDEDMTATDVYNEYVLSEDELTNLTYDLMVKIRTIRKKVLIETDHFVIISKEKNISLTQDFINYRQQLRDLPETLNLNLITENDVTRIDELYGSMIDVFDKLDRNELNLNNLNISFFPNKPDVILD